MGNVQIFLNWRLKSFILQEEHKNILKKLFHKKEVIFCDNAEELANNIDNTEILITWDFKKDLFQKAKNLKYIFTPAASQEWIDRDPNNKVKIIQGTFHGKIISESILGMILYFNNEYHISLAQQKQRKWKRSIFSSRYRLEQQTAMIVGYGNIGRHLGKLLKNFGMNIIGVKRNIDPFIDEFGSQIIPFSKMEKFVDNAHHIIFLLPGNESTQNIISENFFKNLSNNQYIYNFGRGSCINHESLLSALDQKIIAGAGLDVTYKEPLPESDPLWSYENVLLTPHSSCFYQEYMSLFLEELSFRIKSEEIC